MDWCAKKLCTSFFMFYAGYKKTIPRAKTNTKAPLSVVIFSLKNKAPSKIAKRIEVSRKEETNATGKCW